MTFEETLDQALAMLQRRGRMTYRTLQRQFALDDPRRLGQVSGFLSIHFNNSGAHDQAIAAAQRARALAMASGVVMPSSTPW